jgi:hypothetical protein
VVVVVLVGILPLAVMEAAIMLLALLALAVAVVVAVVAFPLDKVVMVVVLVFMVQALMAQVAHQMDIAAQVVAEACQLVQFNRQLFLTILLAAALEV